MYMLEQENFATDFEGFREDILEILNDSEFDEYYPPAVFMVNRDDEGAIFYLEDFMEEHEEMENSELLYLAIPSEIEEFGAKLIAVVLPGNSYSNVGEEQFLMLGVLSSGRVELYTSRISMIDGELSLEGWHRQVPQEYADVLWSYKQSVSPQG